MPIQKYCTKGASKVVITLELPNGRERIIESLAPPITVSSGLSADRTKQWIIEYKNETHQEYKTKIGLDRAIYRSEEFFDTFTNWLVGYQRENEEYVWEVTRNYPQPDGSRREELLFKTSHKIDYSQGFYTFIDQHPHWGLDNGAQYTTEDCYVIEDNERILYFAERTGKEAIRVECISCPEGLCAIRGRNDVVCLDCERVKASLGRIESLLDKLLN